MDIILVPILVVSIVLNVILIFFVMAMRSKLEQNRRELDIKLEAARNSALEQKLTALLRDPDVLGDLARYYHLSENGSAEVIRQGPEVIRRFLNEISDRWQVVEIGPFNTRVPYDPQKHRCRDQIRTGTPVVITKPGWMINGKLLKYATVRKGE